MQSTQLSGIARRFLRGEVGTVERLNLLLFMHWHVTRWWSAEMLVDELKMPPHVVQSHLEHLSARNLLDVRVTESVIYRYHPGREELTQLVEEIARAHYLHRNELTAMLVGHSTESARLFADAFKLRKGKRDG